MTDRSKNSPLRLWPHALLWCLFAFAVPLYLGVVYDEAYERGQILAGIVPYPHEHPLYVYAHNAVGIHYHFAGWMLRAGCGEFGVLWFRNGLHLLMTVLPAFLLGALLARRAIAGHIATALVLAGAYLNFDGFYPLSVWPERFSCGHIGAGYSLLILAAMIAERRALAYLLLALMPLIHVGQMPLLLAALSFEGLWHWRKGGAAEIVAALRWFIPGVIVTALWLSVQTALLSVPVPEVEGDKWFAWKEYVLNYDVHRAVVTFNSNEPLSGDCQSIVARAFRSDLRFGSWFAITIASVASFSLAALAAFKKRNGGTAIVSFCAAAPLLFFGIISIQYCLGFDTPAWLLIWMPHRLTNTLAMLLIPLAIAGGFQPRDKPSKTLSLLLVGLLVWAASLPLIRLLDHPLITRYFSEADPIVFILLGFALTHSDIREVFALRVFRGLTLVGLAAFMLATGNEWPLATLVLGALLACLPLDIWIRSLRWNNTIGVSPNYAWSCLCVVAVVGALPSPGEFRASDRPGKEETAVVRTLRALKPDPSLFVVSPIQEIGWQERTGHPILETYETKQLGCYIPELLHGTDRFYSQELLPKYLIVDSKSRPTWIGKFSKILEDAEEEGYVLLTPVPSEQ